MSANHLLGVDGLTDKAERGFQVAIRGLKGVSVDRERRSEDDERGAVLGALDGLLQGEAADGLYGDFDGVDDLAELVEGAGHAMAGGGDSAAFVVANVVDDVVAAKVFEPFGTGDHVLADHVVAHDLAAEVGAGFDDALDRFGMGAGHDDDVGGAGFGHHFGFEVATVHGLQIGDDGDLGEGLAQGADTVEAFGEDEGCASFEPIDTGAEGEGGGFEGFVDVGEVEGDLDDGFHGGGLLACRLSGEGQVRHVKDDAKCDCIEAKRAPTTNGGGDAALEEVA